MEKETKEAIESALKAVSEFKTVHTEALKKQEDKTGEFESKLIKLSADIENGLQAQQDEIIKLKTMSSVQTKSEKQLELKEKMRDAFSEFAKKGGNGEFVQYLKEAGKIDELKALQIESKAISSSQQDNGGFLVLNELMNPEEGRTFESSPIEAVATVKTTTKAGVEIPLLDGELVAAVPEDEFNDASEVLARKWSLVTFQTHGLVSQPVSTQDLLDDSIGDEESRILREAQQAFDIGKATAYVTGTGVNGARGILTFSNWASAGTYEKNKIEQIALGHASNFTATGIINLHNSLKGVYQANAVSMIKRTSFKNILSLTDGAGNYLFNRELNRSAGMPFDLLGKPLMFAEDIPVVTTNALCMIFGDFRAGYICINRMGVQIIRDIYTTKGLVKFFCKTRYTGGVKNFEALKIGKAATSV